MYLLQASSVDLNLGVHLYSEMKTSTKTNPTFVKEYSKECRVSKTWMKARSIEMHKTIMSPGPHSSVPYGQREADGTGHSGGREAETRDCYLTQWANTNRLSPVTRLLLSERVDKNVIPTFICPQVVFTCDAWSKWPFFFCRCLFWGWNIWLTKKPWIALHLSFIDFRCHLFVSVYSTKVQKLACLNKINSTINNAKKPFFNYYYYCCYMAV